MSRCITLLCIAFILLAGFAAQLHLHNSGRVDDESTCLLCHVTERADVVAISTDAGKQTVTEDSSPVIAFLPNFLSRDYSARLGSRAPPVQSL